jgi:hypothetical protein
LIRVWSIDVTRPWGGIHDQLLSLSALDIEPELTTVDVRLPI